MYDGYVSITAIGGFSENPKTVIYIGDFDDYEKVNFMVRGQAIDR